MSQDAQVKALDKLLAGATVLRVEPPTGAYEGGQFTLVVLQKGDPPSRTDLQTKIRVCGTDLGWWLEVKEGPKEWDEDYR